MEILKYVQFIELMAGIYYLFAHPKALLCNCGLAVGLLYGGGVFLHWLADVLPFGLGGWLAGLLSSGTVSDVCFAVVMGIALLCTSDDASAESRTSERKLAKAKGDEPGLLGMLFGAALIHASDGGSSRGSIPAPTSGHAWIDGPSAPEAKPYDDTWERTQRQNQAAFDRYQANQAAYYNPNSYDAYRKNNIASRSEYNARR